MLLFGRGKVSELMGDVAKGIKSFKKGMAMTTSPPRRRPSRSSTASLEDQRLAGVQTPVNERKAS